MFRLLDVCWAAAWHQQNSDIFANKRQHMSSTDETNQAFYFWGILVSGYTFKRGVFLRGACFRAAVAGFQFATRNSPNDAIAVPKNVIPFPVLVDNWKPPIVEDVKHGSKVGHHFYLQRSVAPKKLSWLPVKHRQLHQVEQTLWMKNLWCSSTNLAVLVKGYP